MDGYYAHKLKVKIFQNPLNVNEMNQRIENKKSLVNFLVANILHY